MFGEEKNFVTYNFFIMFGEEKIFVTYNFFIKKIKTI